MFNLSEIARRLNSRIFLNYEQAPQSPGYYMLFGVGGDLIYVGKTMNLRQRLLEHLSPHEPNAKIKYFFRFLIWQPTNSIKEAEQMEGEIFDRFVKFTGRYPFANIIQPPRATITLRNCY